MNGRLRLMWFCVGAAVGSSWATVAGALWGCS